MKTPSLKKLGLVATGTALALVGAVLSPASGDPVASLDSTITVTKVFSTATVANGGTNTATITATNPGPGTDPTVEDVYVVDWYDPSLTPGVVPGCTNYPSPTGIGRLVCGPVDIADGASEIWSVPFTVNYMGPKKYTVNEKRYERMDVQKAETHVSIFKGEQKDFSVVCPNEYAMLDMALVKQHVDQGAGTFDDLHVVTSDLLNADGPNPSLDKWTVTLKNDSLGQVQAKLWAVCVSESTNKPTALSFTPDSYTFNAHPYKPGLERTAYATCPVGRTPVAVDLRAAADNTAPHSSGSAYSDVLIHKTGMEADGGRNVRVWFVVDQPADITLEWQCMATDTFTNGKRMHFDVVTGSKTVNAGDKGQHKLTCDHGYKGIIGGWTGGKINGSEPQPLSRIYWFWNNTGGAKTYTLKLLCMRTRLVKGGVIDTTYKVPSWNVAAGWTVPSPGTVWWTGSGSDWFWSQQ